MNIQLTHILPLHLKRYNHIEHTVDGILKIAGLTTPVYIQ